MENGKRQVWKRAALWKAALREGPGETPGPAGMALLADLQKLWLARRMERARAMAALEPPFQSPVERATRPLEMLWEWWPEWRTGGPGETDIGHWRGLHESAVHMQTVLAGRPDARNLYPAGVQMAATLLHVLFHATADGDAHAFALAFETLLAAPSDGPVGEDGSTAWCGSPAFAWFPDPALSREASFPAARERALRVLLHLGLQAGIADAAWRAACFLWKKPENEVESSGFRFRSHGNVRHDPRTELVLRAARSGCPDAMPPADSFLETRAETDDPFLADGERFRRRAWRSTRAWRRCGPLSDPWSATVAAAERWARTGSEEGQLWFLHESRAWKRIGENRWLRFRPAEEETEGRPFRSEILRVAEGTGHPVARYFALCNGHDRLPLPRGPALDDFTALCRAGEPLALASLARSVLGDAWPGDAYGPWRLAPDPFGADDPAAFADRIFRERATAGDAIGCFYLGQLAWKEAFDRLEAIRARRSDGTETRLRFLDRDRRFLEVPCGEADRWFRRGAALGGRGARECERTLAWRSAAVRGVPV